MEAYKTYSRIYNETQQKQKNIKEAVKLHMICISSNNDGHPVPKKLTPLRYFSLHSSTYHFFRFKLYPSIPHCTSLPSHLA